MAEAIGLQALGPRMAVGNNSFVHVGSLPLGQEAPGQGAEAPPPYDPSDAALFPSVFAPPGGAYPGPPPSYIPGDTATYMQHGDLSDVTAQAHGYPLGGAAWLPWGMGFRTGCDGPSCLVPAIVISVLLILLDFSVVWYAVRALTLNDGLTLVKGFSTLRYILIAYGVINSVFLLIQFFTLEVSRRNAMVKNTPLYYTPEYAWRRSLEEGMQFLIALFSDMPVFIAFLIVHVSLFCSLILFLESLEGFLLVVVSFVGAVWRMISPLSCTDLGRSFEGSVLHWCRRQEAWIRIVRFAANFISVVLGLILIVLSLPDWYHLFHVDDTPLPRDLPVFVAQRINANYIIQRHYDGKILPPKWKIKNMKYIDCWSMKHATCDHFWRKVYVGNQSDIVNLRYGGYRGISCEEISPFYLTMLEPHHAELYREGGRDCTVIFKFFPVGNIIRFKHGYEIRRRDPADNIPECISGKLQTTGTHKLSDVWSSDVFKAIHDYECGFKSKCRSGTIRSFNPDRLNEGHQPRFSCPKNSPCHIAKLTENSVGSSAVEAISEPFIYMTPIESGQGIYDESLTLDLCSVTSRAAPNAEVRDPHFKFQKYASCENPRH